MTAKYVTNLGNDSTPIDEVHAFYDYWTKFESWRDFTIPARKQTTCNIDMAEGRYEKRWMEREITRQAKILKREEMSRISKLVQTAMSFDPRLRKEKLRLKREKEYLKLMIKEKKEYDESIQTNRENYDKKKQLEKHKIERKVCLGIKFTKESKRKAIRKIRQSFREAVLVEIERVSEIIDDYREFFLRQNLESFHDDLELIFEIFSRKDFDIFNAKHKQMPILLSIITLSPLLNLVRFQRNELREKNALNENKEKYLKKQARKIVEENERKKESK